MTAHDPREDGRSAAEPTSDAGLDRPANDDDRIASAESQRRDPIDPRELSDGRRIEAEQIAPVPIEAGRRSALATFLPMSLLVAALAAAIYLWLRG